MVSDKIQPGTRLQFYFSHGADLATNPCMPITLDTSGPFYLHGLTLIPAWISNYIHYNVSDEITYPFLNFNGATVEV